MVPKRNDVNMSEHVLKEQKIARDDALRVELFSKPWMGNKIFFVCRRDQ